MTGRSNDRRRALAPARTSRRTGPGRIVAGALVAAALFALTAASAGAAGTVTLPGSPLIVSVGAEGQCQSNYLNAGNNFYPGTGTVGDCGFFLGFPSAGNPPKLQEKVYGFQGVAGPSLGSTEYTEVSPGSPTGSGTSADPYKLVTQFKVTDAETKLDYALITETTTYVNGEAQFTSTFEVENITGETIPGFTTAPKATLKFHAIYAGDLFTDNSDFGTGVFLAGPPRFIGGQNNTTGVFGGFIEAGSPSPSWTNFQTGCWNFVPEERCPMTSPNDHGIWPAVEGAKTESPVFNDDVDPNLIDNAAGVSWDNNLTSGLAAGHSTSYSIINRAQIPANLSVQPVTQTHTVGQTATVTITATDTGATPYAGRPLVYSIGGSNPKSGSVTTNASGQATISYVGTAAGLDTMQMFLDLAGTGTQQPQDPASAAQIVWTPAPPAPTPNSTYKVQSIHANSNGTITITFVPTQEGTATVEVTVPTATISRNALAARKLKCKRNQVKIKGKCRPTATLSGKVSATGNAGVALTITVKPSSKVKKALAKGRKVQLTAKLTYRSKLGGAPTVQTFHFTVVKPKSKRRHHH
jgi:hypothetical protein